MSNLEIKYDVQSIDVQSSVVQSSDVCMQDEHSIVASMTTVVLTEVVKSTEKSQKTSLFCVDTESFPRSAREIYLRTEELESSGILSFERRSEQYKPRESYVHEFAFSLINESTISAIALLLQGKDVLSIASGTGAIERCLAEKNVRIVCTDKSPRPLDKSFMKVLPLDSMKAVERFREYCPYAVVSWPEYDKSHTVNALKYGNFEKIVYIGEGKDGCCGDDELFEFFRMKYIKTVIECDFCRWWGIHDLAILFERKKK
jgi:hypothetical protein